MVAILKIIGHDMLNYTCHGYFADNWGIHMITANNHEIYGLICYAHPLIIILIIPPTTYHKSQLMGIQILRSLKPVGMRRVWGIMCKLWVFMTFRRCNMWLWVCLSDKDSIWVGCVYLSLTLIPASGTEVLNLTIFYHVMLSLVCKHITSFYKTAPHLNTLLLMLYISSMGYTLQPI